MNEEQLFKLLTRKFRQATYFDADLVRGKMVLFTQPEILEIVSYMRERKSQIESARADFIRRLEAACAPTRDPYD